MIDLSPGHLATVKAILADHVPTCEVHAFGSRVTWTANDHSDLDLAVIGREPIDREIIAELRMAFEESDLPIRVDIMDWAGAVDDLRQMIQADTVVLRAPRVHDGTPAPAPGPPRLAPNMGALPGWRETTWGAEVTLRYGKRLSDYGKDAGTVPVFGSNGAIGWTDAALVPGPGVVLGRKGANRGVQYSRDPFFVIDTAYFVESKRQNNMRWLYYAIKHYRLGEIDDGSPVPSTTRAAVYPRHLAVPPLAEQRAIANILGTLDDRIELNRQINKTLEAMARALFESWFVDFDPVHAKMDGRDTGLPPEIAALFPDCLVDSMLGEIPDGWNAGTLADIADLNPESWGRRNTPRSIRYVDLGSVKWGTVADPQTYSWERAPTRARRVLRSGDTIVGTVRPRNGSWALIDCGGLTGSTGFAVMRPKTQRDRGYLWCAATSPDALEHLGHVADGAAYPAVRPVVVAQTAAVMPPDKVRWMFSSVAAPLLSQQAMIQRQSRLLSAVRDTLLPALMSGNIVAQDILSEWPVE